MVKKQSIMRWDKKKKKYVNLLGNPDALANKFRTEAGHKILSNKTEKKGL